MRLANKKLPLHTLPAWPLLLDVNEAARFLGISETLFREIDPVESIQIGKGAVRYHIEDLKQWASVQKRRKVKSSNTELIDQMDK